MNLALIGGCGSSGTTLLIHLLSRHPEIVSGPEMKFFNHPEALDLADLKAHQQSLFDRRRLPDGYHVVPTFLRAGEPFGIDRERVFTGNEIATKADKSRVPVESPPVGSSVTGPNLRFNHERSRPHVSRTKAKHLCLTDDRGRLGEGQ